MNAIDDDELRALLPALRRFALWLARDAGDADDLVQASLERALSRWSTRRGEGSLKAWLFAILHRQFLDQRRRAGRWQRVLAVFGGEAGAAPSAEETFVARSSLEAFDALATDHRAVLLLVVVEGLDYREAAQALDVPVGTVMSRLARARAAYRRLTGDESGGTRLRRIG
jgi:RNA polymerase sigma-70 factor (ECF subfamily)